MPTRAVVLLVWLSTWLTATAACPAPAATLRVLLTTFGTAEGVRASGPSLEVSGDGKTWRRVSGEAPLCEPGATLPAPLQIRSADGAVTLTRGPLTRTYRGIIEVSAGPAPRIVNVVDVEDYLRSVVPSEMPPGWPAEALKAQTVAARSYALSSISRHRARKADVCDTTHCQVYRGAASETPATDRAVEETRGIVLMDGGRVLQAEFCSDCGGMQAPRSGARLPSREDAAGDGTHFCEAGPSHRWSARITQETILKALGEQRPGAVRRIRIEERDSSGRITSVTIEHDFGRVTLTGAEMRSLLAPAGMRSTLCRMEADPETGDILVNGLGHGHGAGLCQWGARGRALPPYAQDFSSILRHYFPSASLASMEGGAGALTSVPVNGSPREP